MIQDRLRLLRRLLYLILLIRYLRHLTILNGLAFRLGLLLKEPDLYNVLNRKNGYHLSSRPHFNRYLIRYFRYFHFSHLNVNRFNYVILLFYLASRFHGIFFYMLKFVHFFLFFIIALGIVGDQVIYCTAVQLHRILVLTASTIAVLGLHSKRIKIRGLNNLRILILHFHRLHVRRIGSGVTYNGRQSMRSN